MASLAATTPAPAAELLGADAAAYDPSDSGSGAARPLPARHLPPAWLDGLLFCSPFHHDLFASGTSLLGPAAYLALLLRDPASPLLLCPAGMPAEQRAALGSVLRSVVSSARAEAAARGPDSGMRHVLSKRWVMLVHAGADFDCASSVGPGYALLSMTAAALAQLRRSAAPEAALACVLSHEACHVALRHEAMDWAEGAAERLRSRLGLLRRGGLLASPALARRAAAVDLSFRRAARLRRCELEADALSLRLLARQGVRPELWTVHFEAAEGLCLDDGAGSHPPLAERARRVRMAAAQACLRAVLAAVD